MRFASQIGLVSGAILLIVISILLPATLSFADYAIQGLLLGAVFIVPIAGGSKRTSFAVPCAIGLFWGFWRMAYFDPATQNDIPGIGYFITSILLGLIGLLVYGLRRAVIASRKPD